MANVVNPLGSLEAMVYSGRSFIAFRTTEGYPGISYQLTGRSPPSQARRLKCDEKSGVIRTELITDPKELKTMFGVSDSELPELLAKIQGGNPALTIYPAMRFVAKDNRPRLIVSNGAQTKLMYNTHMNSPDNLTPGDILKKSFETPFFEYDERTQQDIDITSYEPDKPIYTPRVNGCIDSHSFAYHVVRKNDFGFAEVLADEFELSPGNGILIATYKGGNEKPVPLPFERPSHILVGDMSAEELTERVYDAITHPNPLDNDKVYGVAVATIVMKPGAKLEYATRNRVDVMMGKAA